MIETTRRSAGYSSADSITASGYANRRMRILTRGLAAITLRSAPAIASLSILLMALPRPAIAARVSGTFATYQGQAAASRALHFENCVTRDIYMAPTHADGSFAQNLPPGCYDLRAERGAIVRHSILVGETDLALGQIGDLAPFAPARLWHLEDLFPTLLYSPAPSTAFIFTRDATVVPATAEKVPVPPSESEWLKLKHQIEAGGGSPPAEPPAPVFTEPMDFGAPHPHDPLTPAAPSAPPMP
jgi:hypothetical protein